MDAVKSFNQELSSLYEVKPPISKAKMTALTRGAIKAIKFYKHVVQSVEKFILKCKPDYKVPGLYVIDSIVRQSRHQFGSDKDVFAPRFSKNLQQTFINLYKCPAEDKSKIIRVLNLWQKNNVFQPDVIQPLFDLADPNHPIYKELENAAQQQQQQQAANGLNASIKGSPALQRTPTRGNQPGNDSVHGATPNLNFSDPSVIQQLQQLQRLISKNVESSARAEQVHFDRKLLDFDYGDDEDEMNSSPRAQQSVNDSILPVTSLLTNPEVLRQLQTLQQTMASAAQPEVDVDKMRKMQEMKQQEDEFDKHLAQTVPNLPFASECDFRANPPALGGPPMMGAPPSYYQDGAPPAATTEPAPPPPPLQASHDVEVINLDNDDSRSASPEDKYRQQQQQRRRRSRSRSAERRGRGGDRRRSRSRSARRHRSRSRDNKGKGREREREKERERDSERERERRKRGLPVIKKDHMSVCSTTLWVGHLSKLVHQDDLSNTFGEFGDVVSIDLIPPRGCAFIVMLRRQDAARCLAKLKGHVLHGKAITLAWAPGKGVKGKDLKDYWEGDLGVSYVPFHKIKQDIDLELLEDGGMVDEDTMPEWMRAQAKRAVAVPPAGGGFMLAAEPPIDTSQPPPMPPGGGLLRPPPPMMPMVGPFQFDNRMLGLNVPAGMMAGLSNMQMGVPPPSMGGMLGGQLMGLGSPFQGPPGMIASQMPPMDGKSASAVSAEASMHSLGKSLMSLTQSFGVAPPPQQQQQTHDDAMDVEMEDADRSMDQPAAAVAAGEQQGGGGGGGFHRSGRSEERKERRDERDRRVRSRDRDRDRERDRGGRDRTNGPREQDRGERGDRRDARDREFSRGRDRGDRRGEDRRDRNNRWGEPRDARRDAPDGGAGGGRDREKTLNDRLREMAGMGAGPEEGDRERNRERSFRERRDNGSRFQKGREEQEEKQEEVKGGERKGEEAPRNNVLPESAAAEGNGESVAAPQTDEGPAERQEPLGEQPEEQPLMFEPPPMFEGPRDMFEGPREMFDGPQEMFEGPRDIFDGPREMFDGPQEMFDGPSEMFDGPPEGPYDGPPGRMYDGPPGRMYDGPPDRMMFDGPPDMFDGPPDMFDGPPDMFDGPPDMFDGPPDMFEGPPRMWGRGRGRRDGPPREPMDGPPPLHFRGERDDRFGRGRRNFGGRGGMRGGPPDGEFFPRDDFGPRGPPIMMRGGRGHRGRGQFFAPRGRGRGQFRDGPNFNPRLDGPPPFEGGPPYRGAGPRPPFHDGPPMRFRGPAFHEEAGPPQAPAQQASRDGRRSRWGGGDNGEEPAEATPTVGGEGEEPAGREGAATPVADERSPPRQAEAVEGAGEEGGAEGGAEGE